VVQCPNRHTARLGDRADLPSSAHRPSLRPHATSGSSPRSLVLQTCSGRKIGPMQAGAVETDWGGLAAPVGHSYLRARNAAHEPLVATAYEQLQIETDRLFEALCGAHNHGRMQVAFTRCRQPYASDTEMIAAARATRVLEVTTAATSREPLHPLLGCELGGPFDRFRAVHDLIGHVTAGFGFDLGAELAAWLVQDRLHSRLARQALATELLAINSARSLLGEAPRQKAILLDDGLVRRSRALIATSGSPRARATEGDWGALRASDRPGGGIW
jgi:hypothetical protein